MFARNNNRSNEREIKTNFVFKLNKFNFYINFSINLYKFPVHSTVKYCDVEL